jgi:preprotein translocase subunit SecD
LFRAGVTALAPVLVVGFAVGAGAATRHQVAFRPVLIANLPPVTSMQTAPSARAAVAACDVNAVSALASIPTTGPDDDDPKRCVVLADVQESGGSRHRYLLGAAALTGTAVDSAHAQFVRSAGWAVLVRFTKRGSGAWDGLALRQFHKQIAVVLDHRVLSVPVIQPSEGEFSSFGGRAVISGQFTQRAATRIAAEIRNATGH